MQQRNNKEGQKCNLFKASPNQVATFHSIIVNEKGKGLQWVLMALVMAS